MKSNLRYCLLMAGMAAGLFTAVAYAAKPADPHADIDVSELNTEAETPDQESSAAAGLDATTLTPQQAAVSAEATATAPQQQIADVAATASGAQPVPAAPILDADSAQISFQAYITTDAGTPIAGPDVNLIFRLYGDDNNLLAGPIAVNDIPVEDGIVDTRIPLTGPFDGSYREIGVSVNGRPELAPRMPITTVPYAYRVDRVASEELDDAISLGSPGLPGYLYVYSTSTGGYGASIEGGQSRIRTWGPDGVERVRLWGPSWGEMLLTDNSGDTTVTLSATSSSGGELALTTSDHTTTIKADGGSGNLDVTNALHVVDAIGGANVMSITKGTNGGREYIYDSNGNTIAYLGAAALLPGGAGQWFQGDGDPGVTILGHDAENASAVWISNSEGDSTIELNGGYFDGGQVLLRNSTGQETAQLEGAGDGSLSLRDDAGSLHIFARADGAGLGGELSIYSAQNLETVEITGSETASNGAQITLRDAAGTSTIILDADYNGDGRVTTQELEITGGSDLSEQFDVRSPDGQVEPGMIVCIDPDNPGRLAVCSKPYDHTVAGIVSGAGGIEPGMYMGQKGSVADGAHPIALTGRVYALVDASNGAVRPGDLLTTSATPGHAMKATDSGRTHGAVIGKAMTGLDEGKGLVLVLVSLQ